MKSNHVCVIGGDGNTTKIGISGRPVARLAALRAKHKRDLRVVGAYFRPRGDAKVVESLAHRLLEEKRAGGEWFNVSIDEAVEAVRTVIRTIDGADYQLCHPPLGDPEIRKTIGLPGSMWEEIEDYRLSERIATQAEAIRRLLQTALRRTKE